MNDDIQANFERRLRESFRTPLPPAPSRLVSRIDMLPVEYPKGTRPEIRSQRLTMVAAFVLVASLVGALFLTQDRLNHPAAGLSNLASPEASVGVGMTTYSVGALLRMRQGGQIAGEPVAVGGYWSARLHPNSCNPSRERVGDLELRCDLGQWGITELDEPVLTTPEPGQLLPAVGPYIQPFLSDGQFKTLMSLPTTNGQPYPPVPIVVVGHFDDARAADCGPSSIQLCRDRLVVDRVAEFEPTAVAAPQVTLAPTPFPFDNPPSAMFGAEQCAGNVSYSFVGWKALGELLPDRGNPSEVVFAMVTAEVVSLAGPTVDPAASDQQDRPMGRMICYASQGDASGVTFGWVPGSAYFQRADGTKTPITP